MLIVQVMLSLLAGQAPQLPFACKRQGFRDQTKTQLFHLLEQRAKVLHAHVWG